MGLYFYTSLNVMFEYLERSLIAPEGIIHDPHGYRTIGTAADCLFVTHHRLNRDARMQGIGLGFEYPITLEIAVPQTTDVKAILVKTGPAGVQYQAAPLFEYDNESCIGAFLIGEIPWSRVEKVYFDTADEQIRFMRPSADYWYPKDRYDLLPDDFTEEWSYTPDEESLRGALDEIHMTFDTIRQGICDRERMRAGILGCVNGTNPWEMGEYLFNVDPVMQRLLELNDTAIIAALPHYAESIEKSKIVASEDLVLFAQNSSEKAGKNSHEAVTVGINQQIYDIIVSGFRNAELNHHRTPADMVVLLNEVKDAFVAASQDAQAQTYVYAGISAIVSLITGDASSTPEEITKTCPPSADVLCALLYVAKNPNSYDDLIRSFDVYHVDQRTRRRAMILWGELNGLYGIPGEGYNKDNCHLWQFVESYVADASNANVTLLVARPDMTIADGEVLGIKLNEKQNVTAEDIRQAIMNTGREMLGDSIYEKLLDSVSVRKKAKKKAYMKHVASLDLSEIKKGDELTEDILKKLTQLVGDGKDKNAVPDRSKLFADYVEDPQVFAKIYAADPEYWKSRFVANKSES